MFSKTTMIAPDEALGLVLQHAARLPSRTVPLADACGLELAEPVLADRDYPPFPRAMMDGFAVRAADVGSEVRVVGEIAAGQSAPTDVTEGRAFEIMTGAPCPPGTEAVIQKEHVRKKGDSVQLPGRIMRGQHIAPQGSECRAGELVLRPGQIVTPLAVAVMASFGMKAVRVTPRPTLAIITTGAELIPPGQEPGPGEIRDSNGPMLVAMARDLGIDRLVHEHAEDSLDSIDAALEKAAASDIILFTGGVSVGNYDLVPQALRIVGAEVVFHKVRQKPGKPLLFARKNAQLVFGLPGNPLASHLCFHRYVAPAIRQLDGKTAVADPVFGKLTSPVQSKSGRTYFVPAHGARDGQTGDWKIHPLPGVSSADIFASCNANAYVEVPPGYVEIPAGDTLAFTWIGNAPWPH